MAVRRDINLTEGLQLPINRDLQGGVSGSIHSREISSRPTFDVVANYRRNFGDSAKMKITPFLTTIGVDRQVSICSNDLHASLINTDPKRKYRVNTVPLAAHENEKGFLVDVEDVQFTIIPNKALSKADYAAAVAGSMLNWASAADGLQSAKKSLIIAANRPAIDHPSAVKTAFLLSVVSKAVANLVDTAFVFWGTANHLIEPSAFSEAVDAMLEKNQPPILQWVRFDIFKGPDVDGQMTGGMRSKGLRHFVGHEIELQPLSMPPVELARRAVGYADELLRNGPSDIIEIPGPIAGERLTLQMNEAGSIPTLSMQSDAPTFPEVK